MVNLSSFDCSLYEVAKNLLNFQIFLLDLLVSWSNFHNQVAVHSVVIDSKINKLNIDSNPTLPISSIDDKITDNHLLKRQKRVLVFRPLHVYKQQQKEKEEKRNKWKQQHELQQQQYQSNYEQQYYQQYYQNYYNSLAGYYQNYNRPNYVFVEPVNTISTDDDEQYWNSWNHNNEQYDHYHNPYQHTESCYFPSSAAQTPNQYQSEQSLSSEYYYD